MIKLHEKLNYTFLQTFFEKNFTPTYICRGYRVVNTQQLQQHKWERFCAFIVISWCWCSGYERNVRVIHLAVRNTRFVLPQTARISLAHGIAVFPPPGSYTPFSAHGFRCAAGFSQTRHRSLTPVCTFARSPAVIAVIVTGRRYGSITVNKGMLSTFEGLFLRSNARHYISVELCPWLLQNTDSFRQTKWPTLRDSTEITRTLQKLQVSGSARRAGFSRWLVIQTVVGLVLYSLNF